jgi:hypothetical protein
MSKFSSVKRINTRWSNNDFVGEPSSSHTFADALHEEFLVDWAYQIQIGDIVITETPTTGNIQASTLTVGDLVLTGTATGNFGAGSTVVQGTAPISISTTSNTSTVSVLTGVTSATVATGNHLHTSTYQPFGTYVTAVSGTAPIVASTDTAGVASVSLNASYATSTHDHTGVYQAAGTYVTAVNGTAPITASTTTAGIVTIALTASYDPAGTAASAVSAHEADTTSVHGITNTANLLTTSTLFANIANATTTATTISSTTSSAPTDISGMTFTFTPTYDEDVFVQANLIFTQSVSPTATVDIISRFIVNGTIVSPQGGFLRLTSGNSSPTGFTNSMVHTFAVASGVATTVKVAAYRSVANGTFGTSNVSTFSILRVRA